MPVYALTLAYRGTAYSGWQVQKNATAVQELVQNAAERVFGYRPDVTGCSRTDGGVHALAYVCHIESEKEIAAEKLPLALNMHLPEDISVTSARVEKEDFHARYSALGKEYLYVIRNSRIKDPFTRGLVHLYPFPIEEKEADARGRAFEGKHDFRAFMSAGSKIKDTVRTLYYFRVVRRGDYICIYTAADGFLYNMVRIMVGTLLKKTDISRALESCDRKDAGPTAPAEGLYLNRVFYSKKELDMRIKEMTADNIEFKSGY